MKKLVQRNLPLSEKYQVLHITRQTLAEGADMCVCDNCNAGIINIATIVNKDGKKFNVGLDCMKTLTQNILNKGQYEDWLYEFNSCVRFMAFYNKAEKITNDGFYVRITYTDKAGKKQIACEFAGNLEKFGFVIPKEK